MAGDDKPEINFTIRDSNTPVVGMTLDPEDSSTWEPIDLSGVTVTVYFRKLGNPALLDSLVCTNVAPYIDGNCYMTWGLTTLDVAAGTYEGEIELTYATGRKMTVFDKLKFKVRDDF